MISAGFGVFNGQAGFAVGGGFRLSDDRTTSQAGVNVTAGPGAERASAGSSGARDASSRRVCLDRSAGV